MPQHTIPQPDLPFPTRVRADLASDLLHNADGTLWTGPVLGPNPLHPILPALPGLILDVPCELRDTSIQTYGGHIWPASAILLPAERFEVRAHLRGWLARGAVCPTCEGTGRPRHGGCDGLSGPGEYPTACDCGGDGWKRPRYPRAWCGATYEGGTIPEFMEHGVTAADLAAMLLTRMVEQAVAGQEPIEEIMFRRGTPADEAGPCAVVRPLWLPGTPPREARPEAPRTL